MTITEGLVEAERMGWDRIMLSWGEWAQLLTELDEQLEVLPAADYRGILVLVG